jgi:aquaporin Z
MEAAGLGIFMVSACFFATVLGHPSSTVHRAIPSGFARRALMGLAMGLTAIAIIYSPWGQRSGAHINPATTWTFFRLHKVHAWDAVFYTLAQFVGAVAGVAFSLAALGRKRLQDPSVGYVQTLPGSRGPAVAFVVELLMAFGMMSMVLRVSNDHQLAPYTGAFAGGLVALYITLLAPLSGMSINPARSFGSAAVAKRFSFFWLYATAPVLGMLLAAEAHAHLAKASHVRCAKLNHLGESRCIFICEGRP